MANKVLTKLNSNNNTYIVHNNISYSGTGKTLYSDTNGTIDLAGTNGIFPAIDSESVGKLLSSTGTQLIWKHLDLPSEGIAGVAGVDGITVTSAGGIATVGHSNTVTAVANQQAYKVTLDGQGHVNSAPTLYNPDWEQETTTESDFIKHRPAIKRDTSSSSLSPDRNTGVRIGDITNNVASGNYSVAEGNNTRATGLASHAEGTTDTYMSTTYNPTASEEGAHAEGLGTTASGRGAHAEGRITVASGIFSHAEGQVSIASGGSSHAEGSSTTASGGYGSHAEGQSTKASGDHGSHAEGDHTTASGHATHAEGHYAKAVGNYSHAEGDHTTANGQTSHAEGYQTFTSEGATYSHAEGEETLVLGRGAHAEGKMTTASGLRSHAEGLETIASGNQTHAEGFMSEASGGSAHAEGMATTASGDYSHAEGNATWAAGESSHAEGQTATASGIASHAEGAGTRALNFTSHAEGNDTIASNSAAHAEGIGTTASGLNSHAEGEGTQASGIDSHAEGYNTLASSNYQHVQGKYNVNDTAGKYADIVGWGASNTVRKNISSLTTTGELHLKKEVYINANDDGTGGIKLVPDITNNQLKFLRVNSEGTQLEWAAGGGGGVVNGDWDQNTVTEPDFIKHRPAVWRDTSSTALTPDRNTGVKIGAAANTASGHYAVAEGYSTTASGGQAHAEGNTTEATGAQSHAEGINTHATAAQAHVEGNASTASGQAAHAEGGSTTASGLDSHAEGYSTTASMSYAHAEGNASIASGEASHAEGQNTRSIGTNSHAEGSSTQANGVASHTEGYQTITSEGAEYAHAEGRGTFASGRISHAEGADTVASNTGSHAEGNKTTASGTFTHAEGSTTIASGARAHAEGYTTQANGDNSHAEGNNTIANGQDQHVQGHYNVADLAGTSRKYADIVGWGSSDSDRKNISALTVGGELHLAKEVYINSPNADASGGLKLVPALTQVGDVLKIKTMPTSTSAGVLEWGAGGGSINNAGSGTNPVYTSGGSVVASTSTVGSNAKNAKVPVYLNSGTITAITGTVGANTESALKPIYMDNGAISPLSENSGSNIRPVYVDAGAIKPVNQAASGAYTSFVPHVNASGNMYVGQQIMMHTTTSTLNYNTRIVLDTSAAVGAYLQKQWDEGSGTTTKTIYFAGTSAKAGNVGANTKDALNPVYVTDGTITALSNSSGSVSRPVYVNAGKITPVNQTTGTSGSYWNTSAASIPYVTSNGNTYAGKSVTMWPAIDSAYYGLITPTTLTANRTYTLPNKTGTVALTSDLPDDANTTSSTAYPIYMGADSTAGDVTTINMSTGRLLFNPGARKFTIMSAGSTSDVFTFGITKVASW